MEKASILIQMGIFMKANSFKIRNKVMGYFNQSMVMFMRESGLTTREMAME